MADGNSDDLNLLLMEINSHENDWGNQLNSNFEILDEAITETDTHAVTGGTLTLVQTDVISAIHVITGTLVSDQIIEVPAAVTKWYIWQNNTAGDFSTTIKVTGQTGVVLPQGDAKFLRCNGTDIVEVGIPSFSQLAGSSQWIGTIVGTDVYTAPSNGFIDDLSDGLTLTGFFSFANTSTTPTFNYNAQGAKLIVHSDGSALVASDIGAGCIRFLTFHADSDQWAMTPPSASLFGRLNANNVWAGIQTYQRGQIAVPNALIDGAVISWNMALTGPNVTVTLTGATAQLGAPGNVNIGQWGFIEIVQDATGNRALTFHSNFNPMGTFKIDLTANARTVIGYYARTASAIMLWPLYQSGKSSIGFWKEYDLGNFAEGTVETQAHGLGAYPAMVQAYLQCVSADQSYAVGDRIIIDGDIKDGDNGRGFQVSFNTTNVNIRIGNNTGYLLSTVGANVALVGSRWKLMCRVYE